MKNQRRILHAVHAAPDRVRGRAPADGAAQAPFNGAHAPRGAPDATLDDILAEARACTRCVPHLPLGARPVLRASPTARVLIVGQAPGRRVHATGIPWNDPSGDLLRAWLELDRDAFYDERHIAIVPIGLCYPGTTAGGDAPPRPECAPLWQPRVRRQLPALRLTLLVGAYAQAYYLGARRKRTLADTVHAYRQFLPAFFPLPHPSPRNRLWMRRNAWFDAEVVPALRSAFREVMIELLYSKT